MVIYIDILIVTNMLIDYFILATVKKFLHLKCSLFRIFLSALFGAFSSLIIFLPYYPFFLSVLLKILICALMAVIAFGYSTFKCFVVNFTGVFTVSVLFGGAMILLDKTIDVQNMVVVNDIVYFEINPLVLILLSLIIYLCFIIATRIMSSKISNTIVSLKIKIGEKDYKCIGKIDTGNLVCEPFSQSPVIIAHKAAVFDVGFEKARIVPYKTLLGEGIMYAVKASEVEIDKKRVDREVYIGIYDGEISGGIDAIINSQIIR